MIRPINQDDILTYSHVEERPEVVKGDRVKLFSVIGAVTVTADGYALEDGHSGERVKVVNSESGVELDCRVKSEDSVVVEGITRKRSSRLGGRR